MKLVMIVDDSKTVRKLTRAILEELGFRCIEVENGKEALDVCQVIFPEIIILDWNMPVMNGIDFLRSLRKMDLGCYPKVLLCTTENTVEFIQNGMQSGADEYIMKPFDKEIIISKFEQLGLMDPELQEACE